MDAHIAKSIAAKPKLVQISTAYMKPQEGSAIVPRGKYIAILPEKPKGKEQARRPEYKTCKFTIEAIIADGIGKGEVRNACANPACPIHHPKKQQTNVDASFKARRKLILSSKYGVWSVQRLWIPRARIAAISQKPIILRF